MEVLIQYHTRPERLDLRQLGSLTRRVVMETLARAGASPSSEVSVVYVDDAEMRSLNAAYRHIDDTTDVLAFAMNEGDPAPSSPASVDNLLGDVVISLDTAARQARSRKHSLRHEVAVLLIHGVLHLTGHDHVEREDEPPALATRRAHAMRELERACIEHLQARLLI